jgi:hypothetical protein
METNFSVGTYNINGISVTYTAPSVLSKEMMEKIIYNEEYEKNNQLESNNFDKTLKGILSVPKPQENK